MTQQETFDIVVRALIRQGRPSVQPRPDDLPPEEEWTGGSCMYRGADGCKCAAGHLIPDDKYDPAMEGVVCLETLNTPSKSAAVQAVLEDEGHDPLLVRRLQEAHDLGSDKDPKTWLAGFRKRARGVAERFGLSAAAVDEGVAS